MKIIETISTEDIGLGCVINCEVWEQKKYEVAVISGGYDGACGVGAEILDALNSGPESLTIKCGRNADGKYIGDEEFTKYIVVECGIRPELASPDHSVCSIGFCESDGKWYGWSHRARYGFSIGDTVKQGDCAYQAPDAASFGNQMQAFFLDGDSYLDASNCPAVSASGKPGVMLKAIYADTVPNEKLRGQAYEHFCPYPDSFGRGEWTAKTLNDARQMAVDFAESVS